MKDRVRWTQSSDSSSACARALRTHSFLKVVSASVVVLLLVGCQGMDLASSDHFEEPPSSHTTFVENTPFAKNAAPIDEEIVVHKPAFNEGDLGQLSVREQLRKDAIEFWPMVGEDARKIVTGKNALILGAALGGTLAIRDDLDGRVRRNTARHPERWGNGSEVLGLFGNAEVQVPVLLALHASSIVEEDDELHDFSTTLLSAYAINGLSTVAIKGIVNTDRPSDTWNDGEYGFPSFHTSSSVTMAAVLEEYYGTPVAVPAYALAGLISWSRIDQRDHDLSDIVFGAAMGYVIGKTVARNHLHDRTDVVVMPSIDPGNGAVQLLVEVPY